MTFNAKEYQKIYREKHRQKLIEYAKEYYLKNKDKVNQHNQAVKNANPERVLWQSAKERAIKLNLPFEINVSDIVIPKYCPILGIPLFKGKGKVGNNSPSVDKIDPLLGYTKDNIQIISFQANTMKSNASKEDLLLFSYWILERYLD